nr:MAG: RNA-dependent RNA polymerase [Wufeng shrew permutotetravirus 4]
MDTSNPVADNSRITISAMKTRKDRIAKQYLGALTQFLKGKVRNYPMGIEEYPNEDGWEQAIRAAVRANRVDWINKCRDAAVATLDLSSVCNIHAPLPVSGLMADGMPIHPPGVNDSKGKVSAQLQFGSYHIDETSSVMLARYVGAEEFRSILHETPTYSRGTLAGLQNRCVQQLGRKCHQVSSLMSKSSFFELMDKRLSTRTENLPNWGDEIISQIDLLYTSFKSNAGAPYWRSKTDSVDLMQRHVLPLIIDALQNDTLDELFKEQPELWLSALKNKEDRYEDPNIKTRPYLSLPWHWQALFSCLSQPFCRNMHLFHEKSGCRNAYGFSYAHGGGDKIREYVLKHCRPGKPLYFVYGDDVDFYVHHKGKIHRLCPDFKQMDGSVDATTIDWTIDYIVRCFEKEYGDTYSNFWKSVAEEWKMFATAPLMLTSGCNVYQKKRRDGLISGVVGTTLFNTVKSVCAYEQFMTALKHHPSLLEEGRAVDFFDKLGLTIKPGTWYLEEVLVDQIEGQYWTTQKFLGVMLKYEIYREHPILVPTLPPTDWMKLFICPRREESRGSYLARDRYLFDRLRGLLTTGAVFQEDVRKMFDTILYEIDPLAIVMQVQAGGGGGAPPELTNVLGENFRYLSSMGWPSLEWALDLYAPPSLTQGLKMQHLFQDSEEAITQLYQRPEINLKTVAVDVVTPLGVEASVVLSGVPEEPPTATIDASLMPSKISKCTHPKPNPRSKLVDVTDPDKKVKKKPTLQTLIRMLMQPQPLVSARVMMDLMEVYLETGKLDPNLESKLLRPDVMFQMVQFCAHYAPRVLFEDFWGTLTQHMIWPLHELSHVLGVAEERLRTEIRSLGYFVVGSSSYPFVTGVPLTGVSKEVREQFHVQEKINTATLAKVKRSLKTATVQEVPALKAQEQTLHSVITRATQPPATVMLESSKRPTGLPPLRMVPNLEASSQLPPDKLRVLASTILEHNKMRVVRREERDDTGWSHTFLVNDVPVLILYKFGGKASWLYFYQYVVNEYMKNSARLLKDENWADQADREQEILVRVYKTQVGPVLMQEDNSSPATLLQEHPRLKEIIFEGRKTVSVAQGKSEQVLRLSRGSFGQRTRRLEKLLGEPVTLEYMPLKDLSTRFNLVPQYYGRKESKKSQSKGSSSKGRGKTTSKTPTPKTPKTSTKDERDKRPPSAGKRLLRHGDDEGRRQAWHSERTGVHESAGLAGNKDSQRSPIVATMAPYQPPNRNHFVRQQNDGGPVHRVLDGRSRRRSTGTRQLRNSQAALYDAINGESSTPKRANSDPVPNHPKVVLCRR